MTTPTQAQIEAAAKAAYNNGDWWEQIDEQTRQNWRFIAKAALTAAAEVGCDSDVVLEGTKEGMDLFRKTERNATIERCVRVAEDKLKELDGHDGPYGCGPYARAAIESIIAAIRAKGDKP